jgi:hypothetical protein
MPSSNVPTYPPHKTIFDIPLNKALNFKTTRLAEHIRSICLTVEALALIMTDTKLDTPLEARKTMQLIGRVCPSIMLPYPNFLSAALLDTQEPEPELALTQRPFPNPEIDGGTLSPINRFKMMLDQPISMQFLLYYESNVQPIKAAAKNTIRWYQPTWGFGRVVRNAIVHRGQISIDDKNFAPVTWHGITYGPDQNGEKLLGSKLDPPDLIGLMIEMDIALDLIEQPA